MKTTLSDIDKLALTVLDIASMRVLNLMQTHPETNKFQIEIQEQFGKMRAAIIDCGCIRPSSCGSCRSTVEDQIYWSEKMDDLIEEARNEFGDMPFKLDNEE